MILITDEIITNILNINQKDLQDISTYSKDGIVYHEFSLKPGNVSCPSYGSFSCSIKEYRTRKITHSVYHNQECILLYHARRYVCKDCGKFFMSQILLCLYCMNKDSKPNYAGSHKSIRLKGSARGHYKK